jgi:Acyl-CoA dehydrogenase, N-terminal domain
VVLLVIALMPSQIRVTLEDRIYPPFTLGGSAIRATIDPLLKVIGSGWTVCTDEFARRELDKDLPRRDEAGEFSPHAWRACAKSGIQGLPVPEELGGGGADMLPRTSNGKVDNVRLVEHGS